MKLCNNFVVCNYANLCQVPVTFQKFVKFVESSVDFVNFGQFPLWQGAFHVSDSVAVQIADIFVGKNTENNGFT